MPREIAAMLRFSTSTVSIIRTNRSNTGQQVSLAEKAARPVKEALR